MPKKSTLLEAIHSNNASVVSQIIAEAPDLINKPLDSNGLNAIQLAALEGNLEVLKAVLEQHLRQVQLINVIKNKDEIKIDIQKLCANQKTAGPLYLATTRGHYLAAELLMLCGVEEKEDENTQKLLNQLNPQPLAHIIAAVNANQPTLLEVLLKKCSNMRELRKEFAYPLRCLAAYNNFPAIINVLLKEDKSLFYSDSHPTVRTPLYWLACKNNEAGIKQLLNLLEPVKEIRQKALKQALEQAHRDKQNNAFLLLEKYLSEQEKLEIFLELDFKADITAASGNTNLVTDQVELYRQMYEVSLEEALEKNLPELLKAINNKKLVVVNKFIQGIHGKALAEMALVQALMSGNQDQLKLLLAYTDIYKAFSQVVLNIKQEEKIKEFMDKNYKFAKSIVFQALQKNDTLVLNKLHNVEPGKTYLQQHATSALSYNDMALISTAMSYGANVLNEMPISSNSIYQSLLNSQGDDYNPDRPPSLTNISFDLIKNIFEMLSDKDRQMLAVVAKKLYKFNFRYLGASSNSNMLITEWQEQHQKQFRTLETLIKDLQKNSTQQLIVNDIFSNVKHYNIREPKKIPHFISTIIGPLLMLVGASLMGYGVVKLFQGLEGTTKIISLISTMVGLACVFIGLGLTVFGCNRFPLRNYLENPSKNLLPQHRNLCETLAEDSLSLKALLEDGHYIYEIKDELDDRLAKLKCELVKIEEIQSKNVSVRLWQRYSLLAQKEAENETEIKEAVENIEDVPTEKSRLLSAPQSP